MNDLEKRIEAIESHLLTIIEEKARELVVLQTTLRMLIVELDDPMPEFSAKFLRDDLLEYFKKNVPTKSVTGTVEQFNELVDGIILPAS